MSDFLCVNTEGEWWTDIWGSSTIYNAPVGGDCWNGNDEYANYLLTVDGSDPMTVSYCAGSCDETCEAGCTAGDVNGDEIINDSYNGLIEINEIGHKIAESIVLFRDKADNLKLTFKVEIVLTYMHAGNPK